MFTANDSGAPPGRRDLTEEQNVSLSPISNKRGILQRITNVMGRRGQGSASKVLKRNAPVALVVDDDERVREYLAAAMEASGWKVTAVETGQDAFPRVGHALDQTERTEWNASP